MSRSINCQRSASPNVERRCNDSSGLSSCFGFVEFNFQLSEDLLPVNTLAPVKLLNPAIDLLANRLPVPLVFFFACHQVLEV